MEAKRAVSTKFNGGVIGFIRNKYGVYALDSIVLTNRECKDLSTFLSLYDFSGRLVIIEFTYSIANNMFYY